MIWLASHFNQSCVSMTSINQVSVSRQPDGINGRRCADVGHHIWHVHIHSAFETKVYRNQNVTWCDTVVSSGFWEWKTTLRFCFDPATTWHANDCEYEKTPWPQAMRLVRTWNVKHLTRLAAKWKRCLRVQMHVPKMNQQNIGFLRSVQPHAW